MAAPGGNWTNVRARSPGLGALEVIVAALGSVVAALVMHWPLPLHLGRDVPRDLGDPLPQAWQIAWDGHALLHQPLDFFQANVFWPLKNSLASRTRSWATRRSALIGERVRTRRWCATACCSCSPTRSRSSAPTCWRASSARARSAAAVAGAAFAYAPWRLEQDGHLHVHLERRDPAGAVPARARLPARERADRSLAGWLVATWQLVARLLARAPARATCCSCWASGALVRGYRPAAPGRWWRRPRAARVRAASRVARAPVPGSRRDHPESKRTDATVAAFSGMAPHVPGAARGEHGLVGRDRGASARTAQVRARSRRCSRGSRSSLLASLCLCVGAYSRRLRWGSFGGVLACAWLSMGFHAGSFPWPYELALRPPARAGTSSRTPARLNTLTSLGLALLAAGGATWLVARVRRSRLRPRWGRCPCRGAARGRRLLARGRRRPGPAHPTVPVEPAGQRGLAAPQLHLPMSREGNRRYVLWSTAGFPRIVNGRASFQPALTTAIATDVAGFPAARLGGAAARARRPDGRASTPTSRPARLGGAERKPIAGLGITRERRGDVIVFDLPG